MTQKATPTYSKWLLLKSLVLEKIPPTLGQLTKCFIDKCLGIKTLGHSYCMHVGFTTGKHAGKHAGHTGKHAGHTVISGIFCELSSKIVSACYTVSRKEESPVW